MAASNLTAERLRELLDYDPDTGVFRWRIDRPKAKAGNVAGVLNSATGYVQMGVEYEKHYAHRLAFLFMTGAWPAHTVDHIDANRSNNRWANLRDIPHNENVQNVRAVRSHSKRSLLGAEWSRRRGHWIASVRVNRKNVYVGSFGTEEEAHAAYLEAKRRLHPGCTI